jgi:hypothetical protein
VLLVGIVVMVRRAPNKMVMSMMMNYRCVDLRTPLTR